jgi:hypothetical protein
VAMKAEWKAISQSKLESLVASMLERIKTVLAVGVATHVGEFFSFSTRVCC